MDNITHGLFGYALGRAWARDGDDAVRARARSIAAWTGVLASNAPDLDLISQRFAEDPKLDYLIHHRGYTHTLVWALPLGAAVGALVALAHRRGAHGPRDGLGAAVALGALCALLHILFDAFNVYGVHPFHPVDERWIYGDAVYILEPLLWIAMLPLVSLGGLSRPGRLLGRAIAGVLLVLLVRVQMPGTPAWALGALLLGAHGLCLRFGASPRGTLLAATAVVLLHFGASQLAAAQLRAGLSAAVPAERLFDLTRSPQPGNPACWNAIAITLEGDTRYRARRLSLSLLPALWTADECAAVDGPITARLVPDPPSDQRWLSFHGAFVSELSALRALRDDSCRASGALRFLRAPFFARAGDEGGGADGVVGDLRFDGGPGLGFAELSLSGPCPQRLPPWTPPRADLLDGAGAGLSAPPASR